MKAAFEWGGIRLYRADCLSWLKEQPENSIQAVVTDPPYGLVEYQKDQLEKMRNGNGGVWRIPPSFDGNTRRPLPRFTVLSQKQLEDIYKFFKNWGEVLLPALTPGAHVVVASNPLVSYIVANAMADAGYERRGEIVRLTQTMRGGDRPKNAHEEFADVSTMPRSQWEPWLLYRKPFDGRVQDCLREWKTGGLRRISGEVPFGDVIYSRPTPATERELAPHPSLKPQAFLRQIVRAMLPLGEGAVLDPFAGSGSTLAAAQAVGYKAVGVELSSQYVKVARKAIPKLSVLETKARAAL